MEQAVAMTRIRAAAGVLTCALLVPIGARAGGNDQAPPGDPTPAGSAPVAVESGKIDVEGGTLYYEAAGKGEAIVLIHDGLLHREIWDAQFAAFAAGHRVVRYDRRGYGRSPAPDRPYSNVEDLRRLFEQLKIERATLMGMSSGGGLAIDFALKYPRKAAMLVLVGAVVGGFGYTDHMLDRGGHLTEADRQSPGSFLEYWAVKDPYEIAPENKEAKERAKRLLEVNPQDLDDAKHNFAQRPERPALPDLHEIPIPVLVVVGEHDIPDVHAHAGAIRAGISNGKRAIVRGAGHLVPMERPSEFNDLVLRFMADAATPPASAGPYLGQAPPGPKAQMFAPETVSTGMYVRDVAMTPDGSEIYFGSVVNGFTVIAQTRLEGGRWTRPEVAPFSTDPDHMNLEPAISPDGKRLFFLSTRPPDGSKPKPEDRGRWVHQNIWVMDRTEGGWGAPRNLGPPVNTDDEEYFPSVTRSGTLYFTRSKKGGEDSAIYRSRLVNGAYAEPEKLGPRVNSGRSHFNAFIAPDESYLIVCILGREDSLGSADYYIVFRREDDSWSEPQNLGDAINTPRGGEFSPYVSPDGRYFFFMSTRSVPAESVPASLTWDYLETINRGPLNGNAGIWWIDAGFIEDLRRKAAWPGR